MIASLQMYDWPELTDAYIEYWSAIRDRLRVDGIDAPQRLTTFEDESKAWLRSDLVLSQTCGLPYRRRLHPKVTLVGTPDYAVDGCPAGYYRSAFVVRAEVADRPLARFADQTFAFNSETSQSGFAAAMARATEEGFRFSDPRPSGGHRASARMVADGLADICCIDAVSWRFMCRFDDFASALRVVDWTAPTPGLPYITGRSLDRSSLFGAIEGAIRAMPEEARSMLGIVGIEHLAPERYGITASG